MGILGRNLIDKIRSSVPNAFFYLYSLDRDYTKKHFIDVPCLIFTDFSQLSADNGDHFDYVLHLGEEKSHYSHKLAYLSESALLEHNRELNVKLREYIQILRFQPKQIIFASTLDSYGYNYINHDDGGWLAFKYQHSYHEDFVQLGGNKDSFNRLLASQTEEFYVFMRMLGLKVSLVRLGHILDQESVMITRYAKYFKRFRVSKIGSGYQPFNWIHSHDAVNAILHILNTEIRYKSPTVFNLVASDSKDKKTMFQDFCFGLSLLQQYKCFVKIPERLLHHLMGDRVFKITQGTHIYSKHLAEIGFKVEYDTISKALFEIYPEQKKS